MKVVILGFDKVGDFDKVAVKEGVRSHDAQRLFAEMRLRKEPVGGLPVVELWDEDNGFRLNRYFATVETIPKKIIKTMKSIIPFVAGLILLGFTTANAQDPRYVNGTYSHGIQNLYPDLAAITNAFPYSGTIDVRKAQNITFFIKQKRAAAGTNTYYYFVSSPDASNWGTNVAGTAGAASGPAHASTGTPFTICIPDSTTAGDAQGQVYVTNFNTGGVGYLRLLGAGPVWDADATVTNVWIKYSYKISAP